MPELANGAMVMAFTAGADKLKSSAREFLRNLEAWKQPETTSKSSNNNNKNDPVSADSPDEPIPSSSSSTFESALHKMFGSCTIGGTELKCQEDAADDPDNAIEELTDPRRRTTSPQKRRSLATTAVSTTPPQHQHSFRANRHKVDYGEHVYEHLFLDDHAEHHQQAPEQLEPPQAPPPNHDLPRMSSQIRCESPKVPCNTPLGSDDLIVVDATFDDSISQVSAFTLEAMAQAEKLRHSASSDSSLFPSSREPARKRSETTQTTEDSSREHDQWVHTEQGFWEQEAQTPPRDDFLFKPFPPQRAKSHASRRTNDLTASTSSCTTTSFVIAHPHDVIPFEPGDFSPETAFARDPDRIDQVLCLSADVEMAEI